MADVDEAPDRIAFQGVRGANSAMDCRAVHPEMETLACPTFEDTFAAVRDGRAGFWPAFDGQSTCLTGV